jgi:raffinose/stachyose/melibiose transport system permease protein
MTTSKQARWHHFLVFIAPAIILYTVFMIWPLLDSLRWSFFAPQTDNPGSYVYVGLDNYSHFFNGYNADGFWRAFANTIKFLTIMMFLGNPLALLLATLLASPRLRYVTIYRMVIFVPTVLSVIIAGWVWLLMLNPLWGIINDILIAVGLENAIPDAGWLGTPGVALNVVALVATWQFIGLPMILFLAALIGIDNELLDAAKVDGASSWVIFWRIKFPLILPTVGLVVILTIILNFPAFDIQQAMGGRDSFLLANLFYRSFARSMTSGAVVSSIMFAIVSTIGLIYFSVFQRRLVRV